MKFGKHRVININSVDRTIPARHPAEPAISMPLCRSLNLADLQKAESHWTNNDWRYWRYWSLLLGFQCIWRKIETVPLVVARISWNPQQSLLKHYLHEQFKQEAHTRRFLGCLQVQVHDITYGNNLGAGCWMTSSSACWNTMAQYIA